MYTLQTSCSGLFVGAKVEPLHSPLRGEYSAALSRTIFSHPSDQLKNRNISSLLRYFMLKITPHRHSIMFLSMHWSSLSPLSEDTSIDKLFTEDKKRPYHHVYLGEYWVYWVHQYHSRNFSFSFLFLYLAWFHSYSPCTLDLEMCTFGAYMLVSTFFRGPPIIFRSF